MYLIKKFLIFPSTIAGSFVRMKFWIFVSQLSVCKMSAVQSFSQTPPLINILWDIMEHIWAWSLNINTRVCVSVGSSPVILWNWLGFGWNWIWERVMRENGVFVDHFRGILNIWYYYTTVGFQFMTQCSSWCRADHTCTCSWECYLLIQQHFKIKLQFIHISLICGLDLLFLV